MLWKNQVVGKEPKKTHRKQITMQVFPHLPTQESHENVKLKAVWRYVD